MKNLNWLISSPKSKNNDKKIRYIGECRCHSYHSLKMYK